MALLATVACAGETDSFPHLEWRGFGTLGLARSSSDQAAFVRDLSQADGSAGNWTANPDSLLGLQLNAHFNEQFEGAVQAVTRYRYDGSYRPELSWAYAKYTPSPNLTLRAGRLGTEFYMLADSRLVGYSALSVRPSGDYFGGLPFYSIDGADVQATHPLGDGLIKGKLFTGVSREKMPLAGHVWDIGGSRMSGVHLDYLSGAWQWRASYAHLRFEQGLPIPDLFNPLRAFYPDVANSLDVAGKLSRFYSLGAVYDSGPWQAHLMLSRIRQESDFYENGQAGYLLAGYRMSEFTPYLGYSWWKTSPKSMNRVLAVPALNAAVVDLMKQSHCDQHTATLGVRWDFREDMDLKLQWDQIRGKASSIFPVRDEKPGWNGNTNVLSLTLDFIF
jgi:hypothetical protein